MTAEAPSTLSTQDELLWHRLASFLATMPAVLDEQVRALTGVNHFQYTMLRAIHRQPEGRLQMAQLARAADASLSRLSHAVTRLETDGWVERATCEHDRRASWAVLTPAGTDLVQRTDAGYVDLVRATVIERVPAQHRALMSELIEGMLPGSRESACDVFADDLRPA